MLVPVVVLVVVCWDEAGAQAQLASSRPPPGLGSRQQGGADGAEDCLG